MTTLKLTEAERTILYTVLMNGRASVSEIAQKVGCNCHVVHYALRKFRDAGLISRRVMIDIFQLGYSRHAIYTTLSSQGQNRRGEISDFLTQSPFTTVVLEVGGEYDFFVATVTRSSAELAQFNQELSVRFGSLFLKKDVAVTVRHSVFGEKILVTDPAQYLESFYEVDSSSETEPVAIDDIDHRLLYALTDPRLSSVRTLARSLGLPASTIDYRIKRLESTGVICGDLHEIHSEMIGLTNFIVLVGLKGLSKTRHQEFHQFAKHHPNIAHLSFEVGNWDYMLGVTVLEQKDLNLLVEIIRRDFGDSVASVKSFSMFHALKVRDYPIIPLPSSRVSKSVANHDV